MAALLALAVPIAASAAATPWIGDAHSAARLVTATDAAGSGKTVEAGLEIRLAPGWHAYWRSPGDAGVPPSIDWKGSRNLARADISWPMPSRYSLQGFETAGYERDVLLPIRLALTQPGARLGLQAAVEWAACEKICVPYSAKFDLVLPAGPAAVSPEAAAITAAERHVPQTLAAAGLRLLSATVSKHGRDADLAIRLRSERGSFDSPDLFVEGLAAGSPGRPAVGLADDSRLATFEVPIRGAVAAGVSGKPLNLTLVDGERAASFVATPAFAPAANPAPLLLLIAAIALLGGLILNVMPCVLPVLALKLVSVASQAGAERRQVRLGLLFTAAGALASFAAIAATLIFLKAAGAEIGWGIQFQWPWFVAFMAALTALFAASLWGWLPIALPRALQDATGRIRPRLAYADAFATGVFATLLATPCSAPFVGTAIGFALAAGPGQIAVVFAAMGLGFAAPYLLVAAAPGLAVALPRPGRWLARVRAILGFALIGTAVWLLFVLSALSGTGVALGTAAALAVVLLLLAWRSRRNGPPVALRLASASAAAIVALSVLWPAFAGIERAPAAAPAGWQSFDEARIGKLVSQGKVVFVDVTAAWCLTCKVNAAVVLDRDPVAQRLSRVIAMRADWTRPSPALTRYLQGFGRYGVPFDAVYGPGRPQGVPLPELLSSAAVTAALDRAAAAPELTRR